ncbi:MotA/TolQ/ExbB proton channel family protein [Desulfogranum japonicum]|uniref:hypothetical protein n=1 Tax=Desulfogranum japonicum TaxID=231447 RepID=UPI000405AEA7|nr:hypothetical protein [Desulfogranum japonicum]
MIRDLTLASKASCNKEEQETLVPIVKQLTELGNIAFKRGLLALEGELMKIQDPFLALGIALLIDGLDQDSLKNILDSDIYYNESTGVELMKKLIIREGVLRIQAGDTSRTILIATKIFLGKLDNSYW